MASGLGYTKPRKLKECERCGDVKSLREFNVYRDRTNYGDKTLHSDVCIECSIPEEEGEMFCHECMKYKPAKEFRRYLLGRVHEGIIVSANNCKCCESEGALEREWTDVRPTENDADKIDWYCNFIGDTPYKDICKVFKIRYEER